MMPTMSLVVGYLRKHCEPCGFEQLTQEVCGLFPSPGKGLLNAEFYVADARKRYYFEFIEAAAGASGGPAMSHQAAIVLIQGDEVITLISCRGGAGDIWESFMLPVGKVANVAFRARAGRR